MLLAAVVCAHLPVLWAGFTYDDLGFFVRNQSIRSLGGALHAWLAPFPVNDPGRGLFRPLTNISYAVDFALGGGAPLVPHLVNLVLYALACALLYRLLRLLGESERTALLAALLFALHPVHCEAVDSIAGRAELLSLVFTLAAVSVYVRADFAPPALAACAAAVLYALAAASKESGLCLPLLLGGCALARKDRLRGLPKGPFVMLALVAGGYLLLRYRALGGMAPHSTILGAASWSTRVLTIGSVFVEYTRLLLWPDVLAPDYYYTHAVGISHSVNVRSLSGLLLILAGCVATVRAVWKHLPYALGLLFLGAYLLPVSHVVPFGALLAERFLLLPSVGLVLLLLPLFRWAGAGVGARARLALPLAATLMLALGVRSYARAREWHDAVTLWTPVEAVIKDDSRIYNNLALGYMQSADAERSLAATRRSLVLVPDNRIALSNLGEVLMATGRMDEARTSYERTIQLWPDYPIARYNLAVLDLRGGYVAGARNGLLAALRINPNYAAAQALLAQADPLLARARSFLARSRAGAETSTDPALLAQIAAACRATDDGACEASFHARGEALRLAL